MKKKDVTYRGIHMFGSLRKKLLVLNLSVFLFLFGISGVQANRGFLQTPLSSINQQDVNGKRIITGTVVDEEGHPLPGVSVVIKGSHTGVATDINGKYLIELKDASKTTLKFSFIGMISQEIVIGKQTKQNVVLVSDSKQLSDVVVTGYQTIRKERASGSFETIDSEVLDAKISTNIENKLEGQVSGLLFSDTRGSSKKLTIRGVNTFRAAAAQIDPLIVLNGFPLENGDFETINPNDIESVNVLKDAAAASIWGARSANGVIVITTKKAKKEEKVNVSFLSLIHI